MAEENGPGGKSSDIKGLRLKEALEQARRDLQGARADLESGSESAPRRIGEALSRSARCAHELAEHQKLRLAIAREQFFAMQTRTAMHFPAEIKAAAQKAIAITDAFIAELDR